ncbi:sensor domain-containing diguanylate cyclase [Mesorhizobium sp. SB112]|uniref:sensor domain-containing diguanylate cyclase n=1 Tax=Mesorhizobium sp. SB112 TaxID=3151853 RepID=UPI0032638E12
MRNWLVPHNETERLQAIRNLLPSEISSTSELAALCQLVRSLFSCATAAVSIVDEDWQRVAATDGIPLRTSSRDQALANQIVFTNARFTVSDLKARTEFASLPDVVDGPEFRFYAGVPIELDKGLVVGALCILDVEPRRLEEEHFAQLDKFAIIASGLLKLQRANVLLRQEESMLRLAAMTDPLTGLYNRAALAEIIDLAVESSLARGEAVGALYLDMDRFKDINDKYGHAVGDTVLKQAAGRIKAAIRSSDYAVRIGGDEFAVFFSTPADTGVLEAVANRMIDAFQEPFKVEGQRISTSASIGLAIVPNDENPSMTIEDQVEVALQAAKHRGRNRVALFEKAMLAGKSPA